MTKDQEAVAELFKGIKGYSTRCDPFYRYVTVRYEELLKVPWPIRIIPFFTRPEYSCWSRYQRR